LGPGPRLMKNEIIGPRSNKISETLVQCKESASVLSRAKQVAGPRADNFMAQLCPEVRCVVIYSAKRGWLTLRFLEFIIKKLLGMVRDDIANLFTTTCRLAVDSHPTHPLADLHCSTYQGHKYLVFYFFILLYCGLRYLNRSIGFLI